MNGIRREPMGDRSAREDMIWNALQGTGWSRNFREAAQAVGVYEDNYGTPYIAPGDSNEGRGTTGIDAVRSHEINGLIRYDFAGFKSHNIGGDGKRPAYADMITGCRTTIRALIGAAHRGVSIPIVHFISDGGSKSPNPKGWVRSFDAAPFIRGSLDESSEPSPIGFEYGRGQAPAAYIGRVARLSGGKYKKHKVGTVYDGWTIATAEDRLSYPQLRIGYKGANVGDWRPCNVADMPAILDSFDWPSLGLFDR
jgi:hypothetical protein